MKFLVCKKQEGSGCNYTIGCGMHYNIIEAASIEDAQEKTIWPDGYGEWCALEGENALSEIIIVPAEHIRYVDINIINIQLIKEKAEEIKKHTEKIERAESKRLQEKYGEVGPS